MSSETDLGGDFGRFTPSGLTALLIECASSLPPTWLGKRASFMARKGAAKLLRGDPIDVTRFGARMRLMPYANTCEKRIAFTPKLFDTVERAILIKESGGNPEFVFFDIGANIGGYALSIAAQAHAHARLLAVEPQSDLFERLSFNAGLNSFGNLKLVNCALSDQTGFVDLFLNPSQRGEASIRSVAGPDHPTQRVPSMTLLGLAQGEGLSHIDAIKIDVEGAEDIVLKPFFQDAPRALWPALIVIEKSDTNESHALRAELSALGYGQESATKMNAILRMKN